MAPKVVPVSPEVVASDAQCFELLPGEQLVSVSPEGHAWVVASAGGVSNLRVLDPLDPDAALVEQVELGEVGQLQAWSASDAAVIADDMLWRLEALARIQVTAPEGFASPAELCGDPGDNGYLLSAGKLFERRGEQWWVWDPGVGGAGAPSSILRFEGECLSSENLMWLTSADGTLWRVEPSRVSRPVRFERFVGASATEGMLAVLESDRLWIGPEQWQPWIFSGPTPDEVSASGGVLWMASGAQLLRFDGEQFVEVTHALEEPIAKLNAHPSGVWIAGHSTACHQATAPMVRVDGIRPYVRSIELDYPFDVLPSVASMSVTASLDGEAIALTPDPDTGWLGGQARLDEVGWHELVLEVEGDGASGRRSILVKRLPEVERSWATDIAPIYEQHCAGSTCHRAGSSSPPDLGSYEAWLSRAEAIRTRVVEAKTMPPAASQNADWGEEPIQIISQWIEGGMLP